jgi:hypothetical protein
LTKGSSPRQAAVSGAGRRLKRRWRGLRLKGLPHRPS